MRLLASRASGTLPQTLDLENFATIGRDVELCYRLSSTEVDAQSVINWTVVGQLS